MRTFIKTLTTDSEKKEFNLFTYESFAYRDKIIHMVRQCIGMKYLKFVYGNDLWFLYKHYHKDLQFELTNLIEKSKKINLFGNDEELKNMFSDAIVICNNALSDQIISTPINISIENLSKYYIESDKIPNFGSFTFIKTFFTHLNNCRDNGGKTFDGKASFLIPYNAMNQYSAWREVEGQSYEYNLKEIKEHGDIVGLGVENISNFLKLLVSIRNSIYQESISSMLGLLSSLMIDPTYINDYNGYINTFYSEFDKTPTRTVEKVKKVEEPNAIIYKGAYRVLFDEIENSIFNNINNQCRCVITMDKRVGYTTPIVNTLTAKNMFWLLSYISKNFVDFLNDNKILTKFIAYFESQISPNEITTLLNAFYKMPNVSVRDELVLNKSSVGSIFSKNRSPFSLEADEAVDDKEKAVDDKEKEKPEEPTKDDTEDDSSNEKDTPEDDTEDPPEDDTSEDNQDEPVEESADPQDDIDPGTEETEVSDDQPLPEYLLKLDAPPDLNSVLYRHELDRTITCILKNPPKKMNNEVLKMLKHLQAHLIHIIALPQLKLIINKINEGV